MTKINTKDLAAALGRSRRHCRNLAVKHNWTREQGEDKQGRTVTHYIKEEIAEIYPEAFQDKETGGGNDTAISSGLPQVASGFLGNETLQDILSGSISGITSLQAAIEMQTQARATEAKRGRIAASFRLLLAVAAAVVLAACIFRKADTYQAKQERIAYKQIALQQSQIRTDKQIAAKIKQLETLQAKQAKDQAEEIRALKGKEGQFNAVSILHMLGVK